MDALRKLVSDRLRAQAASPHPDPEVLSAFAENALPAKEREDVLQHLSTCSECREVTFLAAPVEAEHQQVVVPPRARPFFALRWGTLAACLLIAAVFLVLRHQTPRTEQLAKTVPQAATAPAATDAIVAAEKTPAELSELHDKLPRKVDESAAGTGHAEPKHITAKPEGGMSFADSGEVRLKEPATVHDEAATVIAQSVPSAGRGQANLKQVPPPVVAPNIGGPVTTARVVGGVVGANANWSGPAVANAPAKKDFAAYGNVAGTVLDSSGAVLPNVRVTAVGPLGTQTATSDQGGKYAFNQLKAGNYQLNFDAPGFRPVQLQQVAVLPDKPANMDVKLQPGMATETVTVEAAAPAVIAQADTALQDQQQTVNESQTETAGAPLSRAQAKAKQKQRHAREASAVVPAMAMAKTMPSTLWQWSLSPQGLVQRSADKGATWQVVPVAPGLIARAISSVANHVWVGGSAGLLYHSIDNGQHWNQVAPNPAGKSFEGDITEIQFVDPQHGTVTTSNAEVWTTTDGGQSWMRQPVSDR